MNQMVGRCPEQGEERHPRGAGCRGRAGLSCLTPPSTRGRCRIRRACPSSCRGDNARRSSVHTLHLTMSRTGTPVPAHREPRPYKTPHDLPSTILDITYKTLQHQGSRAAWGDVHRAARRRTARTTPVASVATRRCDGPVGRVRAWLSRPAPSTKQRVYLGTPAAVCLYLAGC